MLALAALAVEAVGDHHVSALARQEEVLALAVERIVMRPDVVLLAAVRPGRARHGRERRVGTERSVFGDRQGRDRVGAVVGHQQETAGGVEIEMDDVVAAGRLPVEDAEMPGPGMDRIGRRLASVAVHGIEMRARLVDGQEGRVLQPAESLDVPEGATARIDTIDVDSVAVTLALGRGVGADIRKHGSPFPFRMTAR